MNNTDQTILDKVASFPEESRPKARQAAIASLEELQASLLSEVYAPRTLADLDAILPKIGWLWRPWLPRGFVTLLVGAPGVGKSALALALIKSILQGKPWPDGTPNVGTDGYVIWADTESTHAITLERATDWGIPKEKLILPIMGKDMLAELRLDTDEGWWSMQKEAHRKNIRLIVVDSLRGSFRGSENSSEIIGFMTQLAELAMRTQVPLLLIHHLRKRGLFEANGSMDTDSVRGSTTIVQMARCIWALDKPDPNNPECIRCQQIKNNLARFPEPFGFEITERGTVFIEAPTKPQRKSKMDIATAWLLDMLADGPVLASAIFEQAEFIGLNKRTLQRAKDNLGIDHVSIDGQWQWSIPDT